MIGATDAYGEAPADTPVRPEDLAFSVLRLLGVNPAREYATQGGRPMKLLDRGEMIPGIL